MDMSKLYKGKLVKFVSLVLFIFSFNLIAFSEIGPDEGQAAKLISSAWQDRPESIYATLYKEITKPPKTEAEIRSIIEYSFKEEKKQILQNYDPNSKVHREMLKRLDDTIEMNVEETLKRQQSPTRIKKTIWISGEREREDIAYARTPDITLGPNTPVESTFVNLGENPQEEIKAFVYHHKLKSVVINDKGWLGSKIKDLVGLPRGIAMTIKKVVGIKKGYDYVPDEQKVQRLMENGELIGNTRVDITSDVNNPNTKDCIEIRNVKTLNAEEPIIKMICDREDYSHVFRYEIRNPKTNKPVTLRKCNHFDNQGFPHSVTVIEYNLDGAVKEKAVYKIEKVDLNPSIPDEVFEFNPPEGYEVIDNRKQQ